MSDATSTLESQDAPVSAEAFARKHPGMVDAIRKVVREELENSQANGSASTDVLSICRNHRRIVSPVRKGVTE